MNSTASLARIDALESLVRQHEKDIQSLMKQAEAQRAQSAIAPKNVATEFHGEAPSVADGVYKSTLQEAARTGFSAYTVKDGKIMSVNVSQMQRPYTASPEVVDMQGIELKRVRNELGVLKEEMRPQWAREFEGKLWIEAAQADINRSAINEALLTMRSLLHCPNGDDLVLYVEHDVAPFIQAIVDLMQKHDFKGSTKDMPAQIAEWLKLFVHNTNALEGINTRFEEKCAANANLQTQLAQEQEHNVQLCQQIERFASLQQIECIDDSKPAVYFMRGAAKVDMAVAGKHRDSHGRICIEVRDPNS